MENYNEAFFRAKTNKRASITWVLLLIVACIYYGIKVGTGTLTPGYYAAFAIVGWAVYIVGQALLFIKGMDFKPYKCMDGTRPDFICVYPAVNFNSDFIQRPEVYPHDDVDYTFCTDFK